MGPASRDIKRRSDQGRDSFSGTALIRSGAARGVAVAVDGPWRRVWRNVACGRAPLAPNGTRIRVGFRHVARGVGGVRHGGEGTGRHLAAPRDVA